jgi:hypothetical protein
VQEAVVLAEIVSADAAFLGVDDLAVDVVGLVGAQVRDDRGDVFRARAAPA